MFIESLIIPFSHAVRYDYKIETFLSLPIAIKLRTILLM